MVPQCSKHAVIMGIPLVETLTASDGCVGFNDFETKLTQVIATIDAI